MKTPIGPIGIADVIDIVLVSTLVYTGVAWVRRTRAGFVAIGLLLLGALYVAALAFDLRLTTWIFQGFFAIFLVIVVVIFQEELRQFFERVAVWSLRRGAVPDSHAAPVDVLVQCLSDFARERVGALVVLPGAQPIDRHVRGGLELDGKLSVPLLKSIFDSSSPGHDGAVIVEGERVRRFAAHLPLSSDFSQLAGVGTRHSAALGLAELSDALCLVVSEERGGISVAHQGRLTRLGEPAELTAALGRFLEATRPAAGARSFLAQLVRENWVEKMASLLVVAGLWWALVPGSRPIEETFRVPVRVANLPAALVLEEVQPPEIEVTLGGLRRDFYLFNQRRIEVTVDASLARAGRRTFRIDEEELRHPKELALHDVRPETVRISVRPAGPEDAAAGEKP